MRTAVLYLVLLVGVGSFLASCLVLLTAFRYRGRNTGGNIAFAVGLAAFFAVTGGLFVTAFAVPSARRWAIYAAAFLLIARGLAFFVAGRVIRWRERTSPR